MQRNFNGLALDDRSPGMATKVLMFDIGGTIFDWSTAILDALERIAAPSLDRRAFTIGCRSSFLNLTGAVLRGEKSWMTADQILAAAVDAEWKKTGLTELPRMQGVRWRTRGAACLLGTARAMPSRH